MLPPTDAWSLHSIPSLWISCARESVAVELLRALGTGDAERRLALDALRGRVLEFAFSPVGCQVLMLAFTVSPRPEAAAFAAELRGHARLATRSPYANYVLRGAVAALPHEIAGLLAEEFIGVGVRIARHRHGCHILCRLFEIHVIEDNTAFGILALMDEVLAKAKALSFHTYARIVIRCAMERGPPAQRRRAARGIASAAAAWRSRSGRDLEEWETRQPGRVVADS